MKIHKRRQTDKSKPPGKSAARDLRPGRPNDSTRERRRAEIVEVATKHFLRTGFAAMNLNALVDEVGGSKGTLYSHFGNKEGLFSAVIAEAMALADVLSIDAHRSPRLALQRYATKHLAVITSHRARGILRLVIGEATRTPTIARMFEKLARRRAVATLANYLQEKSDLGQWAIENPAVAAEDFYGLLLRTILIEALLDTERDFTAGELKARAFHAVALFLQLYPPVARK